MIQKIGVPPEDVHYPVWAWYRWEGKRKRQDLRRAGYAERGTPMVQITFEAEESEFLLSDFDSWNCGLGRGFLVCNEDELNDFYDNNPNPTQQEIEPSWQRIFDLTCCEPKPWLSIRSKNHSGNDVANQNGTSKKVEYARFRHQFMRYSPN